MIFDLQKFKRSCKISSTLDQKSVMSRKRGNIVIFNESNDQILNIGFSVVFSCWTKMLDMVGLALVSENIQFSRFDGRLSLQQRKESLDLFRNDLEVNVLLISIGSGAVG